MVHDFASGPAGRVECAIPGHLRTTRTQPSRCPRGYTSKIPAHAARFSPKITHLHQVVIGLQCENAHLRSNPVQRTRNMFNVAAPPKTDSTSHTMAKTFDDAGMQTLIWIFDFKTDSAFNEWHGGREKGWWYAGLDKSGPIGVFYCEYMIRVERTETIFSHPDRPDGYSKMADGMSGATDSHAYPGSCIDRIPISQNQSTRVKGKLNVSGIADGQSPKGRMVKVEICDNTMVLRSGQNLRDATDREKQTYCSSVEPVLVTGMNYINDSSQTGCLGNFFLREIEENDNGPPLPITFSLSFWDDIESAVKWTSKSTEHKNISAAGRRHFEKFGPSAELRLWHEMTLLLAKDSVFEFFNCAPETPLLKSVCFSPKN